MKKRKRKIWANHTAIFWQPDVTQQDEPKLASMYFAAGSVVQYLTEVQHMSAPANATSFWNLETEVAECGGLNGAYFSVRGILYCVL